MPLTKKVVEEGNRLVFDERDLSLGELVNIVREVWRGIPSDMICFDSVLLTGDDFLLAVKKLDALVVRADGQLTITPCITLEQVKKVAMANNMRFDRVALCSHDHALHLQYIP